MRSAPSSHRLPFAIAALLLLLLAALATLQWRWTGELADMERQRLQANLQATGARFAEDFDRELTRVFVYFHPDRLEAAPDRRARVVEQMARWQTEAPYPGLVEALYVAQAEGANLALEVLRPPARGFTALPWPSELAAARERLEHEIASGALAPAPGTPWSRLRGIAADLPGIVFPLSFGHGEAREPLAVLLVRLDRETIVREVLPALMRRHFGSAEGNEYTVAVVDDGHPEQAVFRSDPAVPFATYARADARVEMFGLRPIEELHASLPDHGGPHGRRLPGPQASWPRLALAPHGGRPPTAGWTVLIQRRDGSLQQAVAAARRRNLGIGVGILGLIAITVVTLALSAQRAQRLAQQQMEFVAGITHELHTPLAAIRSAGENLADGVVAHPEQVRRYGTLVEREGRRLTDMVGQILEFAGIQSGRRAYRLEPTMVAALIGEALAESRWLIESARLTLEQRLDVDLPPVLADGPVLRRAVKNLIENAVKHGGDGGWLRLTAARGGEGVEITVADHGPGIPREELPHLFEPFFRGRRAAADAVPGAGLGLALVRHIVEAHGGRVTVASGAEGSAFTLHLPALRTAVVPQPAERPAWERPA